MPPKRRISRPKPLDRDSHGAFAPATVVAAGVGGPGGGGVSLLAAGEGADDRVAGVDFFGGGGGDLLAGVDGVSGLVAGLEDGGGGSDA